MSVVLVTQDRLLTLVSLDPDPVLTMSLAGGSRYLILSHFYWTQTNPGDGGIQIQLSATPTPLPAPTPPRQSSLSFPMSWTAAMDGALKGNNETEIITGTVRRLTRIDGTIDLTGILLPVTLRILCGQAQASANPTVEKAGTFLQVTPFERYQFTP